MQTVNKQDLNRKRPAPATDIPMDIKFVKTKEKQKVIICHIIAVSMHLSTNKRLRASVFAKTLKKEIGDLKNFFKEIGLNLEPIKNEHTGEPDIMLHLYPKNKDKQDANILEKAKIRDRTKSE